MKGGTSSGAPPDILLFDPAVFIRCIDLKEDERAVPKQEIGGLLKAYLKETRKLTGIVAAMQS